MIKVQNISKFYAGKRAVDDLSFSIQEGEIVGLLGLNGAGKSTILKILGCFLLPSHGEATVGGCSVLTQPEQVRRMIGYLPDTPPLYNEMTVDSYLRFVASLKEVASAEIDNAVDLAVEKTSLQSVVDARLSELSHGFRQRVGIAQAIVHQPKVLIFDEPINGLDPIQIVEMRDLILSLRSNHTVILSSHILSEITKTCDRILVIDKGRLVAEGSELDLRGGAEQAMTVVIEARHVKEDTLRQLRELTGVQELKQEAIDSELSRLSLVCDRDLRSDTARTLVSSGAELLALGKQGAELESLFVQLVNKEMSHG